MRKRIMQQMTAPLNDAYIASSEIVCWLTEVGFNYKIKHE